MIIYVHEYIYLSIYLPNLAGVFVYPFFSNLFKSYISNLTQS